MKKLLLCLAALAALFPVALSAQTSDLAGTWQGTLQAGRALRIVFKIVKPETGSIKTTLYSIDQGDQALTASETTLNGTAVRILAPVIGMTYEGKLSADGNSIVGTFTQGGSPLPLTLARATTATAWVIPEAAPPPRLMAADADPAFEVATIKPNNTGATSMQQLTLNGRNFRTRASSLGDLICFAYQVQARQIVGGPDWLNTDRFDIDAVPDKEGAPSPVQLRLMIRKLLAERFQLTFHQDQRELPAFVLTVARTGQKLAPTQLSGPLPGIGISPNPTGVSINVRNGTIADFTGFMQSLVLDRPVVDQTALTGRFDFQVTFTPDDTQFNGHPPRLPSPADSTVEAAPSLFDALPQQLGLRLEARKAPVTVIAIDHAANYSPN